MTSIARKSALIGGAALALTAAFAAIGKVAFVVNGTPPSPEYHIAFVLFTYVLVGGFIAAAVALLVFVALLPLMILFDIGGEADAS